METEKKRIKKEYKIKEGRTQKLMTFRVDLDVWSMLEEVANKGRTINDAVRQYLGTSFKQEEKSDIDPAWNEIEDNQP